MTASASETCPDQTTCIPSLPPKIASVLMTREGERALRGELASLREEIDVQLPQRLREAREFGAPSENDDYLQIREEQAVTVARANSLSQVLAAATVIDPSEPSAGVATIGSLIRLRVSGKTIERRLLGAHEPLGSNGMSVASPIGRAILGRPAGAKVAAEMPTGEIRTLEIVAIRSQQHPARGDAPRMLQRA